MMAMRVQRFSARVAAGPRGSVVIVIPFDPDEAWGAKSQHRVRGTVNGRRVRGSITRGDGGWAFTVTPMWMRDAGVAVDDDVAGELAPEGPQRDDLADDLRAALEANPAAAAFFDTLAQFYRRAYLRWINATTRRPDLRAGRIAEVVDLLAAGVKERPRLSGFGEALMTENGEELQFLVALAARRGGEHQVPALRRSPRRLRPGRADPQRLGPAREIGA